MIEGPVRSFRVVITDPDNPLRHRWQEANRALDSGRNPDIEDLGDDAQVAEALRLAHAIALLRVGGFVPVDVNDKINGPWVPIEEVPA